jgi:hypothetical protein
MWVLTLVTLLYNGIAVENLGVFDTHEECIFAMRDAEIAVYETYEGMLCLQDREMM